jgi:hypothetical protein
LNDDQLTGNDKWRASDTVARREAVSDKVSNGGSSDRGPQTIDPDPITLVFLLLAGISSLAAVVNTAIQMRRERRTNRAEGYPRRPSPDLLFDMLADVERLVAQVRILREFLRSHIIQESSQLAIGTSALGLTDESLRRYGEIFRDCMALVKNLHGHGIDAAVRLQGFESDEELATDLQRIVNSVDRIRYSETYAAFFTGMESSLPDLRRALLSLGDSLRRR